MSATRAGGALLAALSLALACSASAQQTTVQTPAGPYGFGQPRYILQVNADELAAVFRAMDAALAKDPHDTPMWDVYQTWGDQMEAQQRAAAAGRPWTLKR